MRLEWRLHSADRSSGSVRNGSLGKTIESARLTKRSPSVGKLTHGRRAARAGKKSKTEVNPAVDDPHLLARLHFAKFRHKFGRTLLYYREQWLNWSAGAYRGVAESELQAGVGSTIKAEFDRLNRLDVEAWEKNGGKDKDGKEVPKPVVRKVTGRLLGDVTLALRSLGILPGRNDPPFWIGGDGKFAAGDVMPIRNALVNLPGVVVGEQADPGQYVLALTPRFFSTYSLDFNFNAGAAHRLSCSSFSIRSGRTIQRAKGHCRSGSAICCCQIPDSKKSGCSSAQSDRVAGRLLGCYGRWSGRRMLQVHGSRRFASPFGLESLIGKPLAIVGDARLSGRVDSSAIVEAFLSISGEDTLTIERKYKPSWTGKLPTRLMLISNELPRLPDQSGTLASRFIVWRFTESFEGKEDLELDRRLASELPSILLWAIEGLQRLRERGHFVQPSSGVDLVDEMRDIGSPVSVFVRERVEDFTRQETRLDHKIATASLFAEWCSWCEAKRRQPGDQFTFGRNLRTVLPRLETKERRGESRKGEKPKVLEYIGISFRTEDHVS